MKLMAADFPSEEGFIFSAERMEIDIIDSRYKKGIIGYQVLSIDLNELASTVHFHELPDAELRKKMAAQEYADNRKENMLIGGLLGGVVDGVIGDDSVVDGVVGGAAAGYLLTNNVQVNMKEQSYHLVTLLFRDGNSITLSVDSTGYSEVIRAAYRAQHFQKNTDVRPYLKSRELRPEELLIAKDRSELNYIEGATFNSVMVGILGLVLLIVSPARMLYLESFIPAIVSDSFTQISGALSLLFIGIGFVSVSKQTAKAKQEIAHGAGQPATAPN
jgi:hypothetical protein